MNIGDWFNDTITKVTGKSPQEHADALKAVANKVVPVNSIATDQGIRNSLKLPSDGPSTTVTGGRRRKTRRGGKKRKTRTRKH
jgi:hypothetical protein